MVKKKKKVKYSRIVYFQLFDIILQRYPVDLNLVL